LPGLTVYELVFLNYPEGVMLTLLLAAKVVFLLQNEKSGEKIA
jgi:hypothetical protein